MEEPVSLTDDAEFCLPLEFLTDDDFLVEKENKIDESNKCLFPYELRNGFGSFGFSSSGFGSTVKPRVRSSEIDGDEESFLAGLTKQMFQPTLEDDFSGGFCGNHAFPVGNDNKAWSIGCGCRNQRPNQNSQSRVSSQATWDLYCAAVEEVARMNITDEPYDYKNHSSRGLLDLPGKHSFAAAKNPNNASGYYNHQSIPYQKLQAIQFQQLKQQQLMKHHRQLVQQSRESRVNSNKNGGPVDLSSSAWSYQLPRRDNSGMRAVFIGDHTGKRGSTGTGVFLPRNVNHNSPATAETRQNPTLATVLVPARVAQVLNLNLEDSVVQSASLNDVSWRQRSNNGGLSSQIHGGVKAEQTVNEPRLPSDWAY